jgi:MYXO-CTERM domain-containing protein
VSGDTVVVGDGGGGTIYVFVRSGTSWTQQAKLAESGSTLGSSVSVSWDTVVVSAIWDVPYRPVYVFVRSGTTWTLQAELTAPDTGLFPYFGNSVSVSGDTAVIGSYYKGSAYVFVRSGASWTLQAELTESAEGPEDLFGYSVGVSGDAAIVSAPGADSKGAAYLFVRDGTSWTQQAKLSTGDHFGAPVSISGNTIIVGANEQANDTGAAYVYVLGKAPGDPCASPAECASGFCVDGVCCATACTAGPCEACSVAAGATADGTCTPLSGPTCDDGDACTTGDRCVAGTCKGTPLDCAAHDACHEDGACNAATGQCSHPEKPNGTACSTGACESGVCTVEFGGCGCQAAGVGDGGAWGAVLLLALPAMRRRRAKPIG